MQYSLDRLAASMRQYAALSGKSEAETVAKQGGKLAFTIMRGLRAIAPGKGSIRESRLAAFKSGRGLFVRSAVLEETAARYHLQSSIEQSFSGFRVRDSISRRANARGAGSIIKDGKRMNFEALAAEREINLRESARGFSAVSVPRPTSGSPITSYERDITSRYGFSVAEWDLNVGSVTKFARLVWHGQQGLYHDAATALLTPREQRVLAAAIEAVTIDIGEYIRRKQEENARACGL